MNRIDILKIFSSWFACTIYEKGPLKAYRYDLSIDPEISRDINADHERTEALIAEMEDLTEKISENRNDPEKLERLLAQIRSATGTLKRMPLSSS